MVCARIRPILLSEVGRLLPITLFLTKMESSMEAGVASVQHSRYCFIVLVTFAPSEAEELEEEESAGGCLCF